MLALFRWLRTVWLLALFVSSGFTQVHVARAGEAMASGALAFHGSTMQGESPYLSSDANLIAIDALKNTLPDFFW